MPEGNKITGMKPGPGRPKGSVNKTTAAAKAVLEEAAERLGGVDRLVEWATRNDRNEHAFWSQMYPKLLPLQVNADVKGNFETVNRVILEGVRADRNTADT